MTKTIFIFRDSIESRYLINNLAKKVDDIYVIFETGAEAKKQKLKREIKKAKILGLPMLFVNILGNVVYGFLLNNYLKKKLGARWIDRTVSFGDVNDSDCLQIVRELNPKVIIIFGTAIIKEPFINAVNCPIFNIHTGILPYYRNVHSEFWAYKNKDYKNIGVSIIHLDKGVDSGMIALQRTIKYKKSDNLFVVKLKVIKLIIPMVLEIIRLLKRDKVPKIAQDSTKAISYPTPTLWDYLSIIASK